MTAWPWERWPDRGLVDDGGYTGVDMTDTAVQPTPESTDLEPALAELRSLKGKIDEGRSDLDALTAQRDELVLRLHVGGVSLAVLAEACGIRRQRIFAIVKDAKAAVNGG